MEYEVVERETYRENNNSADRDSDKKRHLVMVAAVLELPVGRHLSILLIWSQICKNFGWSLGLCSPVCRLGSVIFVITPYTYIYIYKRDFLLYRSLLTDEESELIRHYLVAKSEHLEGNFSNYNGGFERFSFMSKAGIKNLKK
jgi:hypothetical protein